MSGPSTLVRPASNGAKWDFSNHDWTEEANELLLKYDVNGDKNLGPEEISGIIGDVLAQKAATEVAVKSQKHWKSIAVLASLGAVLASLAMLGLVVAANEATKEVYVNERGEAGPAVFANGDGEAVLAVNAVLPIKNPNRAKAGRRLSAASSHSRRRLERRGLADLTMVELMRFPLAVAERACGFLSMGGDSLPVQVNEASGNSWMHVGIHATTNCGFDQQGKAVFTVPAFAEFTRPGSTPAGRIYQIDCNAECIVTAEEASGARRLDVNRRRKLSAENIDANGES